MVALNPVWAMRYYEQQFLGILLEPNNIVSDYRQWLAGKPGGRCLAGAIVGSERESDG
jgi:hypothetical protein